ncbi:hypothetical protein ACFC5T_40805 [Streptomyces sp. NPDC055961]
MPSEHAWQPSPALERLLPDEFRSPRPRDGPPASTGHRSGIGLWTTGL